MDTLSQTLKRLEAALARYEPDISRFPDDGFAYLACLEAFAALKEGNFGVGAVLVDGNGEVVARAHNQMFVPYFRSDLHGEMVLLNAFEQNNRGQAHMRAYSLFSSLEPCTMCLGRLIFSGIGRIRYVAEDLGGGMAHLRQHLPPTWLNLATGRQEFALADCSPALRGLASEICFANADDLQHRLTKRY